MDILAEELDKIRVCESCGLFESTYVYIYEETRVKVLSHVCSECKRDLNLMDVAGTQEFYSKSVVLQTK